MSDERLAQDLVRAAPVLRQRDRIEDAVRQVVASDLPALPVVDDDGRLIGTFGENELLGALVPAYLKTLSGAAFVRRALDEALDRRAAGRSEPVRRHMNTENVRVRADYSDAQVAETLLHHPVLIVPVVDSAGRPTGVITRHDFTRRLVKRLDESSG